METPLAEYATSWAAEPPRSVVAPHLPMAYDLDAGIETHRRLESHGRSVSLSENGSKGAETPALDGGLQVRLSLMMFLQYAIWGAWLPLLWDLLMNAKGFSETEVGNIFAVGAVGAIFGPFIAGQVADRWFRTDRFLAISHLIGGGLALQMASLEDYNTFFWYALIYGLSRRWH